MHGADLVVLAMPLPEVRRRVAVARPAPRPGAMLTDVGTLKTPVLDAVRAFVPAAALRRRAPAGRHGGDAAGRPPTRCCSGTRPWALTLEADTDLDAWLALAELVCDLGAKPVPATAAEQDDAVARVIGLPHVLAEALALTGLVGGPLGL